MKRKTIMLAMLATCSASALHAADIDYTKGVFIVNEDWYGHQNSTVNYLLPDDPDGNYWHYRVIQAENPGMELGCTNQYGAIFNGRFYLIAKQDKDPGATITGGRITVADATTMKILAQRQLIDPSGAQCDGRGFVGVDSEKGYVSTSNGIWILDLTTMDITGQIGSDISDEICHGESGSMVLASGRVFAAHKHFGLLVIDPATDCITDVVDMTPVDSYIEELTGTAPGTPAGIGSVVLAKDGSLWVSVAASTSGSGATLPYLMKVDPETLETEIIDVPAECYSPSNSWYAWTPDTFCASSQENTLYWSGGVNSWATGYRIFRFDIDTRTFTTIIDFQTDSEGWRIYGCSMRVHPVTDEIYCSLYQNFGSTKYVARRYDNDGSLINEYPMIANYWFPSLPVFPESSVTGIEAPVIDSAVETEEYFDLNGVRVDGNRLRPGIYIVRRGSEVSKVYVR